MVAGMAVTVGALAVLAALDSSAPVWLVVPIGALMGPAMAAAIVPSTSLAVAQFPPEEAGTASGVFNSLRQLGSALGVAVPAAAYDVAAGGSFAGAAVFDGTRVALAVSAVSAGLAAVGAARLMARHERAAATVPAAQRPAPAPSRSG